MERSKRLIVLVTNGIQENDELPEVIHQMARRDNLNVLYLVQVDDDQDTLAVTQNMARVKAHTSKGQIQVEVNLSKADDWLKALQRIAGQEEVIVCQKGQMILSEDFKVVPLHDYISRALDPSVRVLSVSLSSSQPPAKKRFSERFALFGFLIILAGFT